MLLPPRSVFIRVKTARIFVTGGFTVSDKILIIDGNSIINRAFYGVPLLSSKTGEYTNAVYGFLNILFKLLEDEAPSYAAVAFDLKAPTFRHIKYGAYKGTRKGMPDELASQLPILKNILNKMNIKIYEKEGYEADDILGTIAKTTERAGLCPIIISGDRDLLQIATDTIKIKIPKTKGGKTEIEDYFSKDVFSRYGVTPLEFIEVKALMGDASDNVPGVPGIGEKTALKIISQYKTVENAIENASYIKPKKASENLTLYKDQALLSKELVTIITDADINFNLDDTKLSDIFNDDVYEEIRRLEFKSMYAKFAKKEPAENKISERYSFISKRADAKSFFLNMNPWLEYSYYITTDKADNNKVIGVSFSCEDNRGTFLLINDYLSEKELFRMAEGFFSGETPKIAHDAKKDIHILSRHNIKLENLVFDTMLAGYIIDSTKETYNFDDIAKDFLNETYSSEEKLLGKGKSRKKISSLPFEELLSFACLPSDISFRSKNIMENIIKENNQEKLYFDIEFPLIFVLADMELAGIKTDKNKLSEFGKELSEKINLLVKEIYVLAGEEFNINSPKQLGEILFDKLGYKGGRKTKKGWSTSADVLENLKYEPIVAFVLKYRTYTKLKSTYADGLINVIDEHTKRIYSTFNQAITATGRISSAEPNLQNIPIKLEEGKQLRKVFVPEDGFIFVDGDYSQIELRVLAHISGDEALINAFKEGADIHRTTASQVFGVPFSEVTAFQRSSAKAVNFGIIYGISSFSLSRDLKITKQEADYYIESYFKKYPDIKNYMNKSVADAKENGFAKTIFNRKRIISEISSPNYTRRSFGERAAMNMPIQGTAADIIKIAMLKVYNRIKKENLRSRLILQVHDELLIETLIEEKEIVKKLLKEEMETAVLLKVPLEIDIHEGKDWYDAK